MSDSGSGTGPAQAGGGAVQFKCAKCGSATFSHPANPGPEDMITCTGCGSSSRYADIQAATAQLVKDEVKRVIEGAFKGKNGWTITKK